ncbi:hypothetical protein QTP88_002772 [Uroleucon formosanum]
MGNCVCGHTAEVYMVTNTNSKIIPLLSNPTNPIAPIHVSQFAIQSTGIEKE